MRNVRKLGIAAVVALAMFIATAARAQVLTMVPADAMVVIKIKNMQDVSAKVAALSQQWGLANIRPELNDPLGTLLTVANLGPGLARDGEAAVAVMMPPANGGEPNMVVLVPVSDFKTFSTSLPNAKAEGELTTFTMGGNPQPGYVADWGKFAAISPQKEMVGKKFTGVQVTGATSKELSSKDLVIYANMKQISKEVLPKFQQFKPQMLQMIQQGMAAQGGNQKFAPVMGAYMGQLFNVAEGFLRDASGVTFGINLSKEGISTTLLAEFDPTSYAGKAVAGLKNSNASFTAGLPDGKYFVYGGMVINPEIDLMLLNDFAAPIEQQLNAMGAEGKPLLDYLASFRDFIGATKQSNFGMVAPPANVIGQQGLIQTVNVTTGDTRKLAAAQKKMFATQNEIMKMTTGGADMIKTTWAPGAKVVEGAELSQFNMTVDLQPKTPQEQQAAVMLQMLYGPKGITGYTGTVTPDRLIAVAGGDDALLTSAVQAAKANTDALGQGPAAKVSASLPQERLGAFYLPIDTIASTVLDVMAARGMPAGVKLPPNLPPLAAAIDSEGSAIRVDGYVPAQTVQSLIAAGMQMWLQGMNGGGAGQPGGL